MNKIKLLFTSLMAATGLIVASSSFAANEPVIQVGTEASFAPFSFKDGDTLKGFDIDVMEAVAKEIGVKVNWHPMSLDSVIQALATNQLDLAAASMSITKERQKKVDFSIPYYHTGLTFIIRTADKDKYKDAESLKGQRIGVQLGSVSAMKAKDFTDKVVNFDSMAVAYIDLKAGGTEAALNDGAANKYFLRTSPNADGLMEMGNLINATDIAMATPKGHKELLDKVNEGIRAIKANGTYDKIMEKWFGTPSSK